MLCKCDLNKNDRCKFNIYIDVCVCENQIVKENKIFTENGLL